MRTKFINDRKDVQDMADRIALRCLDCSCWDKNEVLNCFDTDCPLYPNRLDGVVTKAQIASLRELRRNPSENIEQK